MISKAEALNRMRQATFLEGKIDKAITEAADKGNAFVYYPNMRDPTMIEKLAAGGYQVVRSDTGITIIWGDFYAKN